MVVTKITTNKKNLPSNKSTSKRSMSLMVSRVQRSSPCSALSIASAKFDLSKLWVMASEPLHRVDKRLMVVLTVAVDLLTFKKKKHLKFDNLQYNTLVFWFAGTNDSSAKHLMFQALFFLIICYRLRALKTLYFYFCKFFKK